jgi:hypothetical protein
VESKNFDELTKRLYTTRVTRSTALRGLVAGAAAAVVGAAGLRSAVAGNKGGGGGGGGGTSNDGVCGPLDSGKIDLPDNPSSITIPGVPGYVISGYCVKAGSKKLGYGPDYFETGAECGADVTISYRLGVKDISHYSYTLDECGNTCEALHNGRPCTSSASCCSTCCVAPFKPHNPNQAFVCANAGGGADGVCLNP